MKKESRLTAILSAVIDIIWAGLLWLVFSLPLFTIGASSTALYYAVVKSIRHDRGRVSSCFFQSFRSNFRQATLLWLLCVGYLLIGIGDAIAFAQMGVKEGSLLFWMSRIFFLPVPLLFPWLFAFLSRFQNSLKNTLRYSAFLAMRHFGTTLLLTFELGLFLAIAYLIPLLLPFLPGAFFLLMSLQIEPVFRSLTEGQEDENADAWYNE